MTSGTTQSDAFSHLDELANKRTALEQLIEIAKGIQSQQQAMEGLALIAKPSQEFPAKNVAHLQHLENKYSDLADDVLIQRLNAIEQVTRDIIDKASTFATLDIQELRDNQLKDLSLSEFKKLVADFEQRTKAALVLRFLLKKRGVMLVAFKLPFPQESLADRVQALKVKEQECVSQIKTEAQKIIEDTRSLLSTQSFSDGMKQQLLAVQRAMELNLEHLAGGGSVMDLPNKFEVIVLQSDSTEGNSGDADAPSSTPAPKPQAGYGPDKASPLESKKLKPRKKLSLFKLFIKWLATPWGTSWKSLKEENESEER